MIHSLDSLSFLKTDKTNFINYYCAVAYNKVKTVLDHEVAHFINAIRANGEGFRSKGGMKQFETGTQEYIDSTEEIQARIIQVIKKITNSSPLYKSSYFPKIKLQEFIDMFTKYYIWLDMFVIC